MTKPRTVNLESADDIPVENIVSELKDEIDKRRNRLQVRSFLILAFLTTLSLIDILILIKNIINLDTAEYLIGSYVLVMVSCIYLISKRARRYTTLAKILITFSFILPALVNCVTVLMYVESGYPAEFSVYQLCISLLWFNLAISRWTEISRIQYLNSLMLEDNIEADIEARIEANILRNTETDDLDILSLSTISVSTCEG